MSLPTSTLQFTTCDANGNNLSGVPVTYWLVSTNQAASAPTNKNTRSSVGTGNNNWSQPLITGATYIIQRGTGPEVPIEIVPAGTFTINTELLGFDVAGGSTVIPNSMPLISGGTVGNIPVIAAGGQLIDSNTSPTSFDAAGAASTVNSTLMTYIALLLNKNFVSNIAGIIGNINCAVAKTFRFSLINGNPSTVPAPTNALDGQTMIFEIGQPPGGSATIASWNSIFDFGVAGTPSLSSSGSATDVLVFQYSQQVEKFMLLSKSLGF